MFKPPFVRSAYNYDVKAASDECAVVNDLPSLTVQSQSEEADINVIVKRFGLTGQLPTNVRVPQYGDYDGVTDYREALEMVRSAEESFMKMPVELRNRLENDPQKFLDYCADPANLPEMRKFGLAVPEVPSPPPAPEPTK